MRGRLRLDGLPHCIPNVMDIHNHLSLLRNSQRFGAQQRPPDRQELAVLLVDNDDQLFLTKSSLDLSDTWCHDIRSAYHMRNCPHVYGNSWHLFQSSRICQHWNELSLFLEGDWKAIDKNDFRTLRRLRFDTRFVGQMFETRNLVQIFNQRFGIAIFQDCSVWQIDLVPVRQSLKVYQSPDTHFPS